MKNCILLIIFLFLNDNVQCTYIENLNSLITLISNSTLELYCDKFECCNEKELSHKVVGMLCSKFEN
jgi:hypothetical protein